MQFISMKSELYKGICPIKLCHNRVWRTYKGGKLLNDWQGFGEASDSQLSEEWIASMVLARNPGREHIKNEGLSEFELEDGSKELLKSLIDSNPEIFLGKEHYSKYGSNTGVLVKALDSQERLTIQVHPDKDTADRLFHSAFGKTEAWYIAGGIEIDQVPPYILLGFKPGITRGKWEKMFWEQNIQGMIDSMHKFYVKPGQVFLIEGGVPHAIGSGCFLIEIQEPTDYTIRVERKSPSGLQIDDFLCHQGLGFDKMFECFKFDGYTSEEIFEKWCKFYEKEPENNFKSEKPLISYEDTSCFSINSIIVQKEELLENCCSFSTLVVIDGQGCLQWDNQSIQIKKGDGIFLPAEIKNIILKSYGENPLTLVRCLPPI